VLATASWPTASSKTAAAEEAKGDLIRCSREKSAKGFLVGKGPLFKRSLLRFHSTSLILL
jgi:hypothetical protein